MKDSSVEDVKDVKDDKDDATGALAELVRAAQRRYPRWQPHVRATALVDEGLPYPMPGGEE